MPLQFYKPNAFNTGSAASFSINSKGGCMYAEIVNQISWNDKTQTATFYDRTSKEKGKNVQIKFTRDEIGNLIYALTAKKEFKTVHKSEKQTTTISFGLLYKWDKDKRAYKTDEPPTGYSLTINRKLNDNPADKGNFKMALTWGEAMVFLEFCRFTLDHIFSAIYSDDKKRADAYEKSKPHPADEEEPVTTASAETEEEF